MSKANESLPVAMGIATGMFLYKGIADRQWLFVLCALCFVIAYSLFRRNRTKPIADGQPVINDR